MKFPSCVFMIAVLFVGCSNSDEYVFRNQDRPTYEKSISADELRLLSDSENITLLDVRLLEDFESEPVLIAGAMYKDPEKIEAWFSAIPKHSKVIVYCVKGKWVSQKAANYLNDKGFDAYTLTGGIRKWQELYDH